MTDNKGLPCAAEHSMNTDGAVRPYRACGCTESSATVVRTARTDYVACCSERLGLELRMKKIIRWRRVMRFGFIVAIVLMASSASASMGGIDHLPDYLSVSNFSVNRAAGFQAADGNVSVPSPSMPRKWRPGLTVHVKWTVSDWKHGGGGNYEADVPVDPYAEPGNVYVHFLADGNVRVVVSNYYPWSPKYPGPHDPIPQKQPWNDFPQSWVDRRSVSERLKNMDMQPKPQTPASPEGK